MHKDDDRGGGEAADAPRSAAAPPRRDDAPGRRALGAAAGQLAAWCLLAAVNAALIAALAPMPAGGAKVRLLHHLYDAGHLVALGLASYWALRAASRALPPRPAVRLGAVFVVALAVASALLGEDLAGFVQRRSAAGDGAPWRAVFSVGVALAVTAAAEVGRRLDRPRLRWLAVALGLGAAVAHHFVLRGAYPGFHFFVAWCAAAHSGAAVASLAVPWPRALRGRDAGAWAAAAATLAAIAALAIRPSNAVWGQLYWSPTAVVAPVLGRLGGGAGGSAGPHAFERSPWFRDRAGLPDIPPATPPLLPRPLHVVFLTVDALRADLIADGRHEGALPALTALRRASVDFADARAPSPSTITTIISVLTGKYYSQLYWTKIPSGPFKDAIMPHEDASPRVQQLLGPAGVQTVHVIGLYGLAAELGVGPGFAEELRASRDYAPARDVMSLAIERLQRAGDASIFMYMHFVDPHAPYNLGGAKGTPFERYLREVSLVDREIGRLIAALRSAGLDDRTVLIVSADHGEAFGEHGLKYHATSVYDELLHVPLLVRAPGVSPRRVTRPVSLMDVGPTVLDLYGVPTPATFIAESLVPYLRGEDPTLSRPIAADAGRRMQALVFPDGFKALTDLRKGTLELYDLSSDPGETKNLVDELGDRGRRYTDAMRAFFREHTLKRPGYAPPWRQF